MNRCRVELSVLHGRKERPALWRARRSGHTLLRAGGSLRIVPGGGCRDGTGRAVDGGWEAGKVRVWRRSGESFQRCGLGPRLEGLAHHILKAVEQHDQICALDNHGSERLFLLPLQPSLALQLIITSLFRFGESPLHQCQFIWFLLVPEWAYDSGLANQCKLSLSTHGGLVLPPPPCRYQNPQVPYIKWHRVCI